MYRILSRKNESKLREYLKQQLIEDIAYNQIGIEKYVDSFKKEK